MGSLEGKVAVVTGAASGIGAASAIAMAREGASVVVSDINAEGANATAAVITGAGGQAVAFVADICDEVQVAAMIQQATASFGGLDILHNNAALVDPDFMRHDTTVETMDVAAWDRVMAVNVRGPMLGCKHAIGAMEKRGGGSIIITSSVGAHHATVNQTAYGVSKGALDTLIKYVAVGFGKRGIRCTGIAPGVVLTETAYATLPPDVREMHLLCQPTKRLGVPEDIAEMAVFLASDKAAYVNGVTVPVHGGMTSVFPHQVQLWAHQELQPFAESF